MRTLSKYLLFLLTGTLVVAWAQVFAADVYSLTHDLSASAGGTSSGGPYAISETTGQLCIGNATSSDYAIYGGFWASSSSPPVLPTSHFATLTPWTLSVHAGGVLANAIDQDHDAMWIHAVETSTLLGGNVIVRDDFLHYTPPTGVTGVDEFKYTVVDAGGDWVVGHVSVQVGPEERALTELVFGPEIVEGMLLLRYAGFPGLSYTIEFTDSLAPPVWRKLRNLTAPISAGAFGPGVFEVTDAVTNSAARYFRTAFPAY